MATIAVPLSGTPAGVTFNITGGTSIGLADQTGVTEIPSFTGIPGTATLTITPVFGSCTGIPDTVDFTIAPTPTVNAIADQTQCA
jgi:hypothetical protein